MVRSWLRQLFKTASGSAGSERRRRRPWLESLEDRTLLSASLVADISTTAVGSHPSGFVALNGAAYFFADDGVHGTELWRSDGTTTRLVKDINPGSGSSALPVSPSPVVLGNALYFFADDGTHGLQLWKSDGTSAGTAALSNAAPGSVANVSAVATADNLVFFADPSTGELWKTNGTAGGTAPVTDGGGNPIRSPLDLANVGGALDVGTPAGLYRTDGTPGGTSLIGSAGGGTIANLTDVGGTAFFTVTTALENGQKDVALWTGGGTGTHLVHDFGTVPAAAASPVSDLTAFNGKLYFAADDHTASPDRGVQLWTSDGSGAGTQMVEAFNEGGDGLGPWSDLTSFAGSLYFVASDGTRDTLWRSDGTPSGAAQVFGQGPYPIASGGILTVAGGTTLYFTGSNPAGSGLWQTDGTLGGATFVAGATVPSTGPGASTAVGGTLFFAAADGTHGAELWTSDGTPAGTGMAANINPSPSSDPQALTDVGGSAFFLADDGTHGAELWRSDGTAAGTVLVKDIAPGAAGGLFLPGTSRLLNVNGTVYFFAYDGNPADGAVQLWKSGGTAASTQLVKGFTPSQPGPFGDLAGLPDTLTSVNGKVFFVADDGTHGLELWQTDGTAAGTAMVQDLNAGPGGSGPADLTAAGSALYFTATDGTRTGLWKTDGTTTTFLEAGASNLAAVGGTLYFTVGSSLWKTDGTTTQVKSLPAGSSARLLTDVNGSLAFVVDAPGSEALWASNGTGAGTAALHTFSASDSLGELTAVGSTLAFIDNGGGGAALWTSNGTAAGTAAVAPLTSPLGFFGLTDVNGTLVFAASDPAHGVELWTSNGTPAGTGFAQDINPGAADSFPHGFAAVAGRLFFAADDGTHGVELFADTGGTSRHGTSTTVAASATTVAQGQPVVLTATVQGNVDGGSVTFLDGGVELGTAPVAGGKATLAVLLGLGQHSVAAVYSGDANFSGSTSSPVIVNVVSGLIPTTTTLTASAATVEQGQSVSFTATLSSHVDGGRVDFLDGQTDLGQVPVNGNVAALTVALPDGTHNVVAVYSGDATYGGSTSGPVTVTVTQPSGAETTTFLTASAATVNAGDPVTFTATVTSGPLAADGGTVTFVEDQVVTLATEPVGAGGVAKLPNWVLPAGTHSVVAVYSGDANFAGSISGPVAVTVNQTGGATDTTTTLTASATSVTEGEPVTLTATVSTANGGSVDFIDGQTDLGQAGVGANGVAQLNVTLGVGTHSVVAVYSGDATSNGSESAAVTVTVTQSSGAADTATTLAASATTVSVNTPVTFTATVTSGTAGVTGGQVEFLDGSTDLGTVDVNAQGVARLTTDLAAGAHNIVADYLGDASFKRSTSAAVGVTVNSASGPVSTVTSLAASALVVNADQAVTLSAAVSGGAAGALHPVNVGGVMFLDNGTPIAMVAVDPATGIATLTTVFGPGTHNVTAVYEGTAGFVSSTSSGLTITVNAPPITGDVTALVQTGTIPVGGGKNGTAEMLAVVNVGGIPLAGPLFAVVHGLPGGVTLRGAAGFVRRGRKRSPFVVLEPVGGTMQPNGVLTVLLRFSGRARRFTVSVSAGFPS